MTVSWSRLYSVTWKPRGLSKRQSLRIGSDVYLKRTLATQWSVTVGPDVPERVVEKRTAAVLSLRKMTLLTNTVISVLGP